MPADPPHALFISSQGGRRAGAGKQPSQRALEAGALGGTARSSPPVALPWCSAGLVPAQHRPMYFVKLD